MGTCSQVEGRALVSPHTCTNIPSSPFDNNSNTHALVSPLRKRVLSLGELSNHRRERAYSGPAFAFGHDVGAHPIPDTTFGDDTPRTRHPTSPLVIARNLLI